MKTVLDEERDHHNTDALCRAFYSIALILSKTQGQPYHESQINHNAQMKAIKAIVRSTSLALMDKP